VDNLKMGLRDVEWSGMERTYLLQDMDRWRTLANAAINFWAPEKVWNFMSECTTSGFSSRAQLHPASE
jgi:hypothetical protein